MRLHRVPVVQFLSVKDARVSFAPIAVSIRQEQPLPFFMGP